MNRLKFWFAFDTLLITIVFQRKSSKKSENLVLNMNIDENFLVIYQQQQAREILTALFISSIISMNWILLLILRISIFAHVSLGYYRSVFISSNELYLSPYHCHSHTQTGHHISNIDKWFIFRPKQH